MKVSLIVGVMALTAMVFFAAIRSLPLTGGAQVVAGTAAADVDVSDELIEAARSAFAEETALLSKQITDLEATNMAQETNFEATIAERDKIQSDLDQASQRLVAVETEFAALTTENTDLAAELDALTSDISAQAGASEGADETIQALNNEIETGRKDVETLQTTVADLELERDALTARIVALESNETSAQSATEDRTAQMDALQTTVAELQQERDTLAELVGTLESSAAETQSATADQGAELETLQSTVVGLEQERDKLTDLVFALQSNATETQAVTESPNVELEALVAEQTLALEAAEERIAALTEEAAGQGDVDPASADQIVALTEEVTELSLAVADRDDLIIALQSTVNVPGALQLAICQDRSDAVLAGTQISFNSGTASISAASTPLLEELAGIASDCANENLTLAIEGHTDDVGGEATNLLLSNGRAQAVRDFMVDRGVPGSSLRVIGFGESEPIADNNTDAGRVQNRRIVLDWQQR